MNEQELELHGATIRELLDNPATAVKDLTEVIEKDVPLAQRIMDTANSPLYGQERRKAMDLKSAIVRIGFRNVKRIVMEHIRAQEKELKEGEAGA